MDRHQTASMSLAFGVVSVYVSLAKEDTPAALKLMLLSFIVKNALLYFTKEKVLLI